MLAVLVTYSVSILTDSPLFFFFGISAISWMLPQEKVLFYAGDVEPEA